MAKMKNLFNIGKRKKMKKTASVVAEDIKHAENSQDDDSSYSSCTFPTTVSPSIASTDLTMITNKTESCSFSYESSTVTFPKNLNPRLVDSTSTNDCALSNTEGSNGRNLSFHLRNHTHNNEFTEVDLGEDCLVKKSSEICDVSYSKFTKINNVSVDDSFEDSNEIPIISSAESQSIFRKGDKNLRHSFCPKNDENDDIIPSPDLKVVFEFNEGIKRGPIPTFNDSANATGIEESYPQSDELGRTHSCNSSFTLPDVEILDQDFDEMESCRQQDGILGYLKSFINPVDEKMRTKRNRICLYIFLFGLLSKFIMFAIYITFTDGVLLLQSSSAASTFSSSSDSSQDIIYDKPAPTIALLESITPDFILYDPETPQFHAMNWLIHDDPLELYSLYGMSNQLDTRILQRYILATLFFGLELAEIKFDKLEGNLWLSVSHECTWIGVSCNMSDDGQVTSIDLSGYGIYGKLMLVRELTGLKKLEKLSLSENELIGTLPSWTKDLLSLKELTLSNNMLSGGVTNTISSLVNLETLKLNGNELTGSISDAFCEDISGKIQVFIVDCAVVQCPCCTNTCP